SQSSHLQARADRRDPQGRPVQDRVALQGPREGRALEPVHQPRQGLRLGEGEGNLPEEGMMRRFALTVLFVAWLTAPAVGAAAVAAADIEAALVDLAGSDADRRDAAVAVLGTTGDARWLAFLGALREGSVYARKQGGRLEFLIGGAKSTQGDKDVIEVK